MSLIILLPMTSRAEADLLHLGHSSFQWTTKDGTRILIDPYGNSFWTHWFDQEFPRLETDLLLITHYHYDHGETARIRGNFELIDKETEIHGSDYFIRAISAHHARPDRFGENNLIFVLDIDGVRFCHWGDNDAELTDALVKKLGKVDVLMLPVDESEHLLSMQDISRIIEHISPKVVIPMHYLERPLTSDCSTLRPIDNWLKDQNTVRRIPPTGADISLQALPDKREVWVFDRATISNDMPVSSARYLPCVIQRSAILVFVIAALVGLTTIVSLRYLRWRKRTSQ